MTLKSNNYILLVEDNEDDIELTKLAFQQNKFANRLEVVKDGEQALNFLIGSNNELERIGKPLIILLDLKLPKVDGLEVLEKIKQNDETKNIPVIILTSSKEEEDVVSGYRLGANSYVRKPVNYTDFVNTVNTLGVYWLAINEPPV